MNKSKQTYENIHNLHLIKLEYQIKCGVKGHVFRLTNILYSPFKNGNVGGSFKCKNCGLIVEKDFNNEEKKIIEKLTL